MYYGMSMAECPEPSIVVDRGLALHKVIRLLVMGLGGAEIALGILGVLVQMSMSLCDFA